MERKQDLIFKNMRSGRNSFAPLKHKNGKAFSDLDYFELLGRKCQEIEKNHTNKKMPVDYGNYDIEVVKVAKDVVNALDSGEYSRKDVAEYLTQIIDFKK